MGLSRKQKLWGAVISIAVPIGTMIGMHISWMEDTNKKWRMAIKHAGFWGGMAASLVLIHRKVFRNKSTPEAVGLLAVAAALPIVGYEVAKRIGPVFFPKTQKSETFVAPSAMWSQPVSTPVRPRTYNYPQTPGYRYNPLPGPVRY